MLKPYVTKIWEHQRGAAFKHWVTNGFHTAYVVKTPIIGYAGKFPIRAPHDIAFFIDLHGYEAARISTCGETVEF